MKNLEQISFLEKPSTDNPGEPLQENSAFEKREILRKTTAYINAGGRGTRLESVLPKDSERGITKALIDFSGGPILLYHIRRLNRLGVGKIVVLAGDHKNIGQVVGDELRKYQNVEVRFEEKQKGTGGDLMAAVRAEKEPSKWILVINVDTLLEVDEGAVLLQHKNTGAKATIVLTTRKNVPNEGAFSVNRENRVIVNLEATNNGEEEKNLNPSDCFFRGSSTGMVVLNAEVLSDFQREQKSERSEFSLYREILGDIFRKGELYAYNNGENFFMDIGTKNTYEKVQRRKRLGPALEKRSLSNI